MNIVSLKEARALGINTYYTGNPCKYGHDSYRYVLDRRCAECAKIKCKLYITNNRAKITARNSKAWADKSEEDRARINANRRAYYVKTRSARLKEKQKSYEKLRLNETWVQEKRTKTNLRRALYGRTDKQYPLNNKKWKLKNKDYVHASLIKRYVSKINRSPKWLSKNDLWMMKEIYALAILRSQLTGIKWHVDHKIPLQGKLVSGLHVPTNLQVIPAIENTKKGNKFEVVV